MIKRFLRAKKIQNLKENAELITNADDANLDQELESFEDEDDGLVFGKKSFKTLIIILYLEIKYKLN